jgi:hypothetical protein
VLLVASACTAFEPLTGAEVARDAAVVDGGAPGEASPPDGPVPVSGTCTDADSDPTRSVSFHDEIRPMLDRLRTDPSPGCRSCHYSTEPVHIGLDEGGLDLATLGALRFGGNTSHGSVVVPGRPCESAIVQKLLGIYPHGVRMPKDSSPYWTDREIQVVADWIFEGAMGQANE